MKAWEAIILEKKVLVVSTTDAVITPCCDFLRRLVLPLTIVNTYVPLLSPQLIYTVEAPFPYLLGANTTVLLDNLVDYSDTVVVDLDVRAVFPEQATGANPKQAVEMASRQILTSLVQEVNSAMMGPLRDWIDRPSNLPIPNDANQRAESYDDRSSKSSTYSSKSSCSRKGWKEMSTATQVLRIFAHTNLSLMCAQTCSMRTFFRHLDFSPSFSSKSFSYSFDENDTHLLSANGPKSPEGSEKSAYGGGGTPSYPNSPFSPTSHTTPSLALKDSSDTQLTLLPTAPTAWQSSLHSGYMQYCKYSTTVGSSHLTPSSPKGSSYSSDTLDEYFIPSWVEMDACVFTVYEYADDLSVLYIRNEEIITVSPTPIEPEGHVFEVVTSDSSIYRFRTTDVDSRQQWIALIERTMKRLENER